MQNRTLSTEAGGRSERPIPVTIPENVVAIHSMILDERKLSIKR
jgi:hypothetical protein